MATTASLSKSESDPTTTTTTSYSGDKDESSEDDVAVVVVVDDDESGANHHHQHQQQNGKGNDGGDDVISVDSSTVAPPTYNVWHIVSNIVFVIASSIYLTLGITVLPQTRFYQDVPTEVLYATDDAAWWNYYNETDQIPFEVLNATDNQTWGQWYNESFYPEDDIVFQVNPAKSTSAVSQYMILYFLAAFGFLCTGLLETALATTCKGRMLYLTFFIAAGFGVMSSMLVVADPYVATVLNAVSVHLFAVEAISAVVRTYRMGKASANIEWMLVTGNMSLVIGTVIDVVLSYYYVLDLGQLPHARAAIVAACFCLIFLYHSLRERKQFKNSIAMDDAANAYTEDDDDDIEEKHSGQK
ncbi:MAG: hypothetical protein SGARI_001232 [Bacillariaceae sp.]